MDLLDNEMVRKGIVSKTDMVQKLTIDGKTKTYPVYKIKLDALYYNDQNARISTRLSQYDQEHGSGSISKLDRVSYNNIIHQFIYDSNPQRLEETQLDISFKGQQLHGVVLRDGRVIDGNRRFTCLRNLAKKDDRFNYFEAVIIRENIDDNAKAIKKLELALQMGVNQPVPYDPIDRLVGLYKDVVENKLLTIEEYTKAISGKLPTQRKELEIAELLVEFLECIHAPKQYYIARDLKVDGPIRELYAALKKISNQNQREDLKTIGFAQLIVSPVSDMTPYIRKYKTIAESRYLDEFIETEIDNSDTVLDNLGAGNKQVDESDISALRADDAVKKEMIQSMEIISKKVGVATVKNKPLEYLQSAYKNLKSIDVDVIQRLEGKNIKDLSNILLKIEDTLKEIREVVDVY